MYAAVIADAGVMDLLRYPLFIVGADALEMHALGAHGAVVHLQLRHHHDSLKLLPEKTSGQVGLVVGRSPGDTSTVHFMPLRICTVSRQMVTA